MTPKVLYMLLLTSKFLQAKFLKLKSPFMCDEKENRNLQCLFCLEIHIFIAFISLYIFGCYCIFYFVYSIIKTYFINDIKCSGPQL